MCSVLIYFLRKIVFPTIEIATVKKHLYTLASDAMEGRQAGTIGIEKAAQYIETAFEDIGLRNKIFSFAAVRSLLLSLLSDKTGNSLSHVREVEKKRDPN